MIDINDKHDYLGMWFLAGDGRDWLAIVYRAKGSPKWTLAYRFRYYADPDEVGGFDPFDGKDHKNWYRGTAPADRSDDALIEMVDKVMHNLVAMGFKLQGTKPWRRIIADRSYRTLFEELKKAPFAHVSTEDAVDLKPTTNQRGQA